MSEKFDFERVWLQKFSNCLDDVAGKEIQELVMEDRETLTSETDAIEIIHGAQAVMGRLESNVNEESLKFILTGYVCQYPKSNLQDLRKEYEATKDLSLVHRKLQERFETFLRETLG